MSFVRSASAVAVVAAIAAGGMAPAASAVTPAPASTASATAQTVKLTKEERAQILDFFRENQVPRPAQMRLLHKLERGQAWDSMLGKQAVHTETFTHQGAQVTLERFADGSVSRSEVQDPTLAAPVGEASIMGITGCRTTSSSLYHANYVNCYANVDLGVVMMGFHFDRNTVRDMPGKITKYYSHTYRIIGGALHGFRYTKFNDQQVRLTADFSVAFKGFPAGWDAWMQVNLGRGTSVWTTHN